MDLDDGQRFALQVMVVVSGIVLVGMALEWLWNPETEAWGAFELIAFVVAGFVAVGMVAARQLRD